MMHTFFTNDRVIVDPDIAGPAHTGLVYRVIQISPVYVVVEPEGGGRALRITPNRLRPAPDNNTTGNSTVVSYQAPLDPGTLVTVSGPGWKQPPETLYVVLRDNGWGRASIVELGGNNGRYWRGAPRRLFTVIDPARVRLAPEQTT